MSIWYRHGFDNRVAPQIKSDMIRLLGLPPDVKTSVSVFFPQNNPGNNASAGAQNNSKRGGGGADQNTTSKRARELTSYSSGVGATGTDTTKSTTVAAALSMDDMLE